MPIFPIGDALLDALVLSIVEKNDVYGYRLTRDIQKVFELSESTVYPVLRRLEQYGYLETYDVPCTGRNRRYYHITDTGKKVLAYYRAEWIEHRDKINPFLCEEESE